MARRCLPAAEARRQVDGRRQKDSEPRGVVPAAARSLGCWAASEISSEDSSRHAGAATSAFIMSGTVQLSEPQPAPCAKDSAMAARRAAASQIGDPACLYVFHRVSFDARMCNSFRSCSIVKCVQKEIESDLTQPFSLSNYRVFPPGAGRSLHSATRRHLGVTLGDHFA